MFLLYIFLAGKNMGINISEIIKNLIGFYNLNGKSIIHVGIGSGIFTGYTNSAKKIFAYDNNPTIENNLRSKLTSEKALDKYEINIIDFFKCKNKADVVFFEFCLHEIEYPLKALEFAKTISDDILIIDHAITSEWSHYTLETEKLKKSWNAINTFTIKKHCTFKEYQHFNYFTDLKTKLSILGEECMKGIEIFENKSDIYIPMPYEICLI